MERHFTSLFTSLCTSLCTSLFFFFTDGGCTSDLTTKHWYFYFPVAVKMRSKASFDRAIRLIGQGGFSALNQSNFERVLWLESNAQINAIVSQYDAWCAAHAVVLKGVFPTKQEFELEAWRSEQRSTWVDHPWNIDDNGADDDNSWFVLG